MRMLINEVSKITGLTKKAIEYYIEQGLIFPSVLENGYRNFKQDDVEQLKQIAVLRKLGISTEDIKIVLTDDSKETLKNISLQKELNIQRDNAKKEVLDKLCSGKSFSDISKELDAIEKSKTILEKLLEAFPGYFGRYICLHFARFLNEPIKTERQQAAYERVISFLDNMPRLSLPDDLQKYILDYTEDIGTNQINKMIDDYRKNIENIDEFLSDYKEILEKYMEYRQSEEYQKSPAGRLMEYMKEFNSTNGYYDEFIPALKELSPSYAEFYKQLELANEKLMNKYPGIDKFYNNQI